MLKRLEVIERDLGSGDEEVRWAAAADLSEYVFEHADAIWPLVLRFGASDDADLRSAIATNVLEHILEYHFDDFFPLLEREIVQGNENLRDTLRKCWKFGQSEEPSRSKRWDALVAPG